MAPMAADEKNMGQGREAAVAQWLLGCWPSSAFIGAICG
jgi:hypothetical protein